MSSEARATVGACGRTDCPVPIPAPALLARLRTTVLPAGRILHRGHKVAHPDPTELVPGAGDSRFAPLPGVAHAYLATTRFAALLEPALHEASPPEPRVYEVQLARWLESTVTLNADVRLIDLRDGELLRLGLRRDQLVATVAAHYRCTRVWAEALHGRRIGGQDTHGLVWHSRQRELHANTLGDRPALRDIFGEAPAETAVVWSPPADPDLLGPADDSLGPLHSGAGLAYVENLTALLGITIP